MHFHGDNLACETRDIAAKEVFFFSLNFRTGTIYLRDFQLEEKWWVEIENLNSNTIFFNYFRTPELPEHLGITAIDMKTGKNKWTNTELTYWFSTKTEVYAAKAVSEKKLFFRLDSETGAVIEEYNGEEAENNLMNLYHIQESGRYSNFINTEIFNDKDDTIPDEIRIYFNRQFMNSKILGNVEFLIYNRYLIYNYHQDDGFNLKDLNERNLTNILQIYNLQNRTLDFSEVLNKNVSNYVPDSFFINDGYLFFVKDKKELTIINLNNQK